MYRSSHCKAERKTEALEQANGKAAQDVRDEGEAGGRGRRVVGQDAGHQSVLDSWFPHPGQIQERGNSILDALADPLLLTIP